MAQDKNSSLYYDLITFSILGFISGLPFALVTSTFQAWLTQGNVSIASIGLFGLVSIPYAMKPLWAVLIDWLRIYYRIGLQTVYFFIVVLLALTLYVVSCTTELLSTKLALLMLFASFLSSTIDICVDAMRVIFVDEKMQGLVSSWFVIFYRIAFILSGGLGLVIASHTGWNNLYFYMSVLTLISGFSGYLFVVYGYQTVFTKDTKQDNASVFEFFYAVHSWVRKSYAQVFNALLFIFLYKYHGNFLTSLVQVFLIDHAQMSLEFIGYTYKTFGMLATFAGGVLGGMLSRSVSTRASVLITIFFQCVATSLFVVMAADILPCHPVLVTMSMYMESLCIGLSTTLITVIITKNCDSTLAATQYAFFTAAIAWERTLINPISGYVQSAFGWTGYFMCSLLMFPFLLMMILERKDDTFKTLDQADYKKL